DNAVDAGLVVAVAAGNSGPGAGTVESPGRARKVITVGASTNQHFVGQPFTYPAGVGTTIGAAVGEFPALPTASYNLFDTNSTSCTSVDPGASGKRAIVNRGTCSFSTKLRNRIPAGAVLVDVNAAHRRLGSRTPGSPFDLVTPADQVGPCQSRRLGDQRLIDRLARHRSDGSRRRAREPLRSGRWDNVA